MKIKLGSRLRNYLTLLLLLSVSSLSFGLVLNVLTPPSYAQSANAWNLHRRNAGNDLDFYYGLSGQTGLRLLQGGGEIQARKFTDLDSTGTYIDPGSTSIINALTMSGALTVNGSQTLTGNLTISGILADSTSGYYVDPSSISQLNDTRTRILYDLDNTGYYVDPSNISNFNYIYTSSGNHLPHANGTNYLRGNLIFNGILYDESNGAYYLDPAGTSVTNDLRANIIYDTASTAYYVDPATITRLNDLRPTIMYDPDNTGYYLDINGNSRMGKAQFDQTLINWPGYNGIAQAYGHYIWPGRNDGSNAPFQQSWYLASHSSYGLYTNTGMHFAGQIYAPGWTDLNNGAYGVDPNGYSTFWVIRQTYCCNTAVLDENGGGFQIDPSARSDFNYFYVRYFYDGDNGNYYVDLNNTSQFNGLNAVSGNTVSDIRIKKDITPLQNSLSRILKLRGVNYYNRQDTELGSDLPQNQQVGLIAQEAETVIPEIVTTGTNGYKSIEYGKLSGVIVEAIKEQQSQIETLKTTTSRQSEEIKELKETINLLQEQLAELKK